MNRVHVSLSVLVSSLPRSDNTGRKTDKGSWLVLRPTQLMIGVIYRVNELTL